MLLSKGYAYSLFSARIELIIIGMQTIYTYVDNFPSADNKLILTFYSDALLGVCVKTTTDMQNHPTFYCILGLNDG